MKAAWRRLRGIKSTTFLIRQKSDFIVPLATVVIAPYMHFNMYRGLLALNRWLSVHYAAYAF